MKTILITIFSPFAARNILRDDFLRPLVSRADQQLVLVVPDYKQKFYQQQLTGYDRIIVEGVGAWHNPTTWLDKLFFSLSLHYLETETVKILRRTWGKKRGPLFSLFNHFSQVRRLCRWLDWRLVVDRRPWSYLDKYQPELVMATHAIYFQEQAFVREAKRRKITTISVVNSWDNLSVYKGVMRVLPDQLAVPNELVKKEAEQWCDLPTRRISVIGMWNCDHYFKTKPSSREDFCRRLDLDPGRPFILFASIGRNYSDTEWQDIAIIQQAITAKILPSDLQILIRSHPDPGSPFECGNLSDVASLRFQAASTPIGDLQQNRYDITSLDDQGALDAIYHSALVLTIQSTISIEAALLDRPVININFDGWEKKDFYAPKAVKRYHQFTHYLPVHKIGGVRLVATPAELVASIKQYLAKPSLDQEARRHLAEKFCWRLDGQAFKRLNNLILSQL